MSDTPTPIRVVGLRLDLGAAGGHRLWVLGIEDWGAWLDLRFARVDEGAPRPLPRRVPPTDAWRIAVDDTDLDVLDVVGRGDRSFSNGEARCRPGLPVGARRLTVEVRLDDALPVLGGAADL